MPDTDQITDFTAARRALRKFLASAQGVSADTTAKLEDIADAPGSPVNALIDAIELLYGRRAELDAGGRGMAAQLTNMAMGQDFFGMRSTGRGAAIVAALTREDSAPQPGDPAPLPQFAPPAAAAQPAV